MDPYRFGYSPIVERPKLSWPNGARVAVWACPNIEHYEYVPEEVRWMDDLDIPFEQKKKFFQTNAERWFKL